MNTDKKEAMMAVLQLLMKEMDAEEMGRLKPKRDDMALVTEEKVMPADAAMDMVKKKMEDLGEDQVMEETDPDKAEMLSDEESEEDAPDFLQRLKKSKSK